MLRKYLTTLSMIFVATQTASAGTIGETYNMNGLYAGLGVGEATIFINEQLSNSFDAYNISTIGVVNDTRTGVLFQGQVGYGKMVQSNTYLGLKGSVYYTPLNYYATGSEEMLVDGAMVTVNDKTQFNFEPIFNIDAVLGYELYPHVIPFVQAGVSFAGVNALHIQKNSGFNMSTGGQKLYPQNLKVNKYVTGYNVGIGSTYQANKHLLLSGELIYNYIGKYFSSNTTYPNQHLRAYTSTANSLFQQVSLFVNASYLIPGS
ncbi:MAG: hypothetical protein P1U32_06565 [Legionellaceae bacterium]|nr:hypothetical protein [Legionellaceae bacterium]